MIPRAAVSTEDPRLDAITQALVESVQPQRIILFGSRARGDARTDSDYDLVVELDFDDYSACSSRLRAAIHDARGATEVDVWPRRPGEVERRGRDPGYMDWDIVREGIILYPSNADSESLRPQAAVRESPRYQSIKEWLARADQDLRIIEQTLLAGEGAAWGAAGFHAQQMAEKYLKILFVQRGARPPHTHDLKQILLELRQLGYDLPNFAIECELLKDYAVAVRYPDQLPLPNEQTGRAVIAAARTIVDVVTPMLQR
jgi:HEPN domain-containing protein/predicted nucleotidyltransferase